MHAKEISMKQDTCILNIMQIPQIGEGVLWQTKQMFPSFFGLPRMSKLFGFQIIQSRGNIKSYEGGRLYVVIKLSVFPERVMPMPSSPQKLRLTHNASSWPVLVTHALISLSEDCLVWCV